MARELSEIQQPGFVQQAARAYGLGGRKEIAFALAPDAPPLPDDAPGSASHRLGSEAARVSPARPLADAPVRPRRLTAPPPARLALVVLPDLVERTTDGRLAHNSRPLTETVTGGRATASPPPTDPPHPDMVWVPGGTFRMGSDQLLPGGAARPTTSPSTASGWTSTRSRSPSSAGS